MIILLKKGALVDFARVYSLSCDNMRDCANFSRISLVVILSVLFEDGVRVYIRVVLNSWRKTIIVRSKNIIILFFIHLNYYTLILVAY